MKCLEQLQPLRVSFFLLFFLFSLSFGAKIEITLKDIVYLQKKEILLSDIAVIKTKNNTFLNYLKSIKVGYTLTKAIIKKNQVLKALKENFIDLSQVKINGNQTIVVLKKFIVNSDYIKNEITQFLKRKYPDIKIKEIQQRKISLGVIGKPKIIIKEKGKTSSYIYLTVKIPSVEREFSVSVKYAKLVKAVVARKALYKGHTINPDDIKLSIVELKRRKEYIDNIQDAIGKTLKRNVKKGQPITYDDLKKQFLVRKNSNVRIIYKKGVFKIELLGRALENGELGQVIKVKNISSGKVIQCKIVGANKVEFISGQF